MTVDDFYRIARNVWDKYAGRRPWKHIDREDAVQVAVMHCWRYRDRHDVARGVPAHAYFGMLAKHAMTQLSMNQDRRKRRPLPCMTFEREEQHPLTEPDTVIRATLLSEQTAALRKAMEQVLTPTARQVLLRLYGGETMQRVADDLGCTRQAVMIRRDRAIQKLANHLTTG